MAEKFDPYYKWLGIPPKDQPPSYYRLLGLEVFESDPEVIDRAANRLMDYLHSITDGQHLAQSQALLNQIATARLCLLDEEEKARYDDQLRAEQADQCVAPSVRGGQMHGEAIPPVPPAAPPLAPPPVQLRRGNARLQRPRQQLPVGLLVGLAACLVALGGIAIYLYVRLHPRTNIATTKRESPTAARAPEEARTILPDAPRPTTAEDRQIPDLASPASEPPKKDAPLQPRPETAKLLESAHEAIKKKNVKEAIELLDKYLDDPAAPEPKEALLLWDFLRYIVSGESMLRGLARMSEKELLEIEQGIRKVSPVGMPAELQEIFDEAVRSHIPEAKRRLAMKSKPGEAPKEGAPKEGALKERAPKENENVLPKETPGTPEPKPASAEQKSVPDPLTKPAEFLASQGLLQRGSQWQLEEEPALTALAALVGLEKKYLAAANKTAEGIKSLNKLRAQLSAARQQVDQVQARGGLASPQAVQFFNEWEPKIGTMAALGNNAELRALLLGRIEPRNELLLAVLAAHKSLDPLTEKYQRLAGDPRMAEALSKRPGEKAGPSARFSHARAQFAKTESLVLADETPLFLQGRDTMLSVVINDIPCELAWIPRERFNVMSEALAKKLGVTVPPNAPRTIIERFVGGKKEEISAREVTIPGIRLGKHLLKDQRVLVTGPEGAALGSGLYAGAFDGFRIDTDYDNFMFKIRPEGAPGKAAR